MNDSLSTISPAWPTHWPKDSFSSIGAWLLAAIVTLIFVFAFVAGMKTSNVPIPPSIDPRALDIGLAVQLVLEGTLVAVVMIALPRISKFSLRDLGFRMPGASTVGIAILGAAGMVLVADGGESLIAALVHTKHEQQSVEMLKALHDPASTAFFIFFAAIFATFAEEVLFRVFLFNFGLRHGGFWAGAVVSSLLFGLAHGDAFAALPLALGGIVLCAVYYRTGNAWASMISHGLFNGLSIVLLLTMPNLAQ